MSGVRSVEVSCLNWREAGVPGRRQLVPEVPVALIYDGGTEAVMMATPHDLEEFALGFSLNEKIITHADEIRALDIVPVDRGIEVRILLVSRQRESLVTRRRMRAGPAGCGLCGIESIGEALPALPPVNSRLKVPARALIDAMSSLEHLQVLNLETRASHAAALFVPGTGIVDVREDVGRHNALDKLAGALWRRGQDASAGVVLMTSRISVELVQKTVIMGAPVLAGISAPTSLAVSEADCAGLTLAGLVRADGFSVFTHPERISDAA